MTALIELYRLPHLDLVNWVSKEYGIARGDGSSQFLNEHRVRREMIARRLRLYRDKCKQDIEAAICQIYETADYQLTLKRYVDVCKEQNVTRRIIDEIGSLYDRPVLRTLADKDAEFHAEEKRLRLHELMQEGHRLLTLCNEVLLWSFQGADDKQKLRLVTPDMFDAIPHPVDSLVEAGILIDMPPISSLPGDARAQLPHYELWDDTYRYLLNAHGQLVDENGKPALDPIHHGGNGIPGVLLHRREPTTCILDADHGSDIDSCHLGVALLNVMIMRLSKSQGERQPVLQGNLAAVAAGQVMNGERPLMLPPEVVASMLDTKTDPDHYLAVKKDKISSTAVTYGMSYEQVTNSETSDSGKLFELRREKLKEIRAESRRRAANVNEPAVIRLMGFDPEGARFDYQEQSLPQDASEKVALLREKMKLGLDSPVEFLRREDPDLTRQQAELVLQMNLRDYAQLIVLVRQLNMPGDGDAEDPGKSPQENGADNGAQGQGSSFAIGAQVTVRPGKEHDPSHRGMVMTIAEARGDTYALKMPDGSIHRWYAADELMDDSMSNAA